MSGKDIPLLARIIAVADSFDAMISDRHYRKALSPEQALEEIRRCAGTQFDPEIVGVFAKMVEEELKQEKPAAEQEAA